MTPGLFSTGICSVALQNMSVFVAEVWTTLAEEIGLEAASSDIAVFVLVKCVYQLQK